jgi:hypothetical protein
MILDRFIRLRDAPGYLGINKNDFNATVRPLLTEIPMMARGIGFDRLELDAWFEEYKARNGRPPRTEEMQPWQREKRQGSPILAGNGSSIKESQDSEDFLNALESVTRGRKRKPSRISAGG